MPRRAQQKRRTPAAPEPPASEPKRVRSSEITFQDLQSRLHLPLLEAATSLSISPTIFKRVARQLGVPRWPFRQMSWIATRVQELQEQLSNTTDQSSKAAIEEGLKLLNQARAAIVRDGVAPTGQVKILTRALRHVFKNAKVEVGRTSSWEQTDNESDSDIDELEIPNDAGCDDDAAELSAFSDAPAAGTATKAHAASTQREGEAAESDDDWVTAVGRCWAQIEEDEQLFEDLESTLEVVAMYIF